jgi:O-antigen/teichoic acid export membrane protein
MKQHLKNTISHPLIAGSGIVVIGGLTANLFNFFFNIYMSRSLPVSEYGLLASIISLIGMPGVAITAIVPIVVSFAGEYFANKEIDKVRGLYIKLTKFILIISAIFFVSFLLITPEIKSFFHIKSSQILILTDITIVVCFIGVINTAFIQAKMKFTYLAIMNVFGTFIKLISAFLFVKLGLSAFGGVISVFLAMIAPYLISFFPLKFIFNKKVKIPHIENKKLFAFGIPSVLIFLGLNSIISTDIILVKHFFTPESAGVYAGLSLVGRIIFFISAPIAGVMFPIVVQKFNKKEKYTNTFFLSLLLVLLPAIALTVFYTLFPNFAILFFLKNAHYLQAKSLLPYFALFITFYSLLNIISNFYLSIKKTQIAYPIIAGAILQIILICLFHQSYSEIIGISGGITLLLLIVFLLYYPYAIKE